jgi:hypothetical protein
MKFFKHILYLSVLLLITQGAFAQITKAGSETAVNTVTANSQRAVSVSHNSSGEYAIVWESFDKTVDTDESGIWLRIYNANGTDLVASSLFNSTYTIGSQSFPTVALNADGDYVVAWMTNDGEGTDVDGWGIRMSYKNTDGTTFQNQVEVNSATAGNQKFPRIALAESGSFVVVWESDGDIKAQRYNALGTADGSEMAINTNASGAQLVPDVAVDDDGDFIVVWQSDTTGGNFDIHAQRYNSAGVAQGNEFKINTTTSEHQLSPRVAMDDAGNFAVTWASYDQDGDDYGVYTRRFSSDGTALSSEVKVNTTSSGTQTHPAIDMGPEGTYIISWTSFNQDGDAAGIYAQAFSPTGSKKGAERLINTTTAAFQTLPALSMTGDADKALFAWQSGEPDSTNTQDGDDYGIFLQAFDVADMIDPVAVAQDLTVYLDASGNAVITGADLNNGSTDNVGVTSYTASKTAFDCDDLGDDNTVTLTVADAAGNESTDTSVITVSDTISPVVVTQDIIVTLNSEGVASFSDKDIDDGSTDNCGIVSYAASTTLFGSSDLGDNVVTLTVTDASGNDKSATATVTVVKMDQSITFDALSPVTYGDADFGLGATASSGLSVNYSSSNTSVAVINGTTVEIIGVGTTTITASQAGDANYKAAADVPQLLTVNELPITVTADDKSKDFGDADPGFTFSVTSGALVGSDAFTGDLTRDAGESLGQYDITVGTLSAGSNYDLTYIQGVFEIFDLTDPVFTSGNSFSVAEGATGTVFTATATDLRTVSYALGTGGDESLFNISDGAVSFKNAPDFENPLDGNTDNIYAISVEASDGVNTVTQAVSITVTDVDEIDPVFTSGTAVDFAENGSGTAYTAVATDANIITYSLGTGNDESDFNIDGSTGVITFKSSPDFENPADGDTDNDYVIDVKANDGLNEAVQTVTITVTDVFEDPARPNLIGSDPLDDATGFAGTTITLTFDRNVFKGSGIIEVLDASDDAQLFSKGVNHADISINGAVVTIDMKSALALDKDVYLNVPATAFKDVNDGFFVGITDKTTLNFSTPTSPMLVSSSPADDAVEFGGTTIDLTFDRTMSKGSGLITLFDASDDSQVWSVGVNNPNVSITGTTVTLNTGSLPLDTDFYLNVGASALMDTQGLSYVGISDKTTLNFSGQTSPQLISSSPADGATGYDGTTVTLTFDRNMFKGSGTVSLSDASTDAQIWARGINHPDVTINGATVTFAVGTLPIDKEFYVSIASTSLKDASNVFYSGISDKTTLNFFGRTSPVLLSSTPADDETDFDGTSITLSFDRNILKGTGTISLKDASDDSEVWGVGVNHPNVVVNGSTVTLNVGALPLDKDFYLNIGSQAFKDNQDAFYSGISDKTTLNFSGPTTPKLISSNPADEATGFSGTSITLTFDRNVTKGFGLIAVLDASDDSQIRGGSVNLGAITINGAVVTINMGIALPVDKEVYLNIAATAFKDADNHFYAGISDKTTLNFDTNTPAPSRNPSDLTTEIVDEQQSGVWLYPNPATNKITIDLSAAGEAPDVQITDATGAGKFLKEKVEKRLLTIDVSQYAGGVYIVLVRNQDGSIAREKFMIRR